MHDGMRRLDPKAILILSIDWLRAAVYPIVVTLVTNGKSLLRPGIESRAELLGLLIPLGIGVFAILGAVVSYFVTRFGILSGSLIVRKRGIWRQERTIPLERIQNVMITQGLLERLLGIATVKVETASGHGVEASLKSVSYADAEIIKQQLMQTAPATSQEAPPVNPVVYKAELKDIALAGVLQNRALIVIATILGVFNQGIEGVFQWFKNAFLKSPVAPTVEHNPALAGLLTFVGFLLFLIFGWILSIGYAVLTYYNFKVVRTDKGLQVSYGLVNTVQTVIPIKRIQSIQTSASWLFKFFGLNQLSVQSIGGHSPEHNRHVATGQTMLAPICRPKVLRQILTLINPSLNVDGWKFLASDRFLLVRSLTRSTMLYSAIIVVASLIWAEFAPQRIQLVWVIGFALWLLSVLTSVLSYRRQGYVLTQDVFVVCHGTFGQGVIMVPVGNVQSVTMHSNWFMRRRGLVDLRVNTPVSAAVAPCVQRNAAEHIRDELMSRAYGLGRSGL